MMWEKVRLEDICEINMGKTPSRNVSDYWNGEYPWVSIADLKGDYYIKKTKEKISSKAVKESGIKAVPKNTLLYSFKLSIGKVAITESEIFTNEAIVALPIKDNNRILLSYLYWAIQVVDLAGIGDTAVMGLTLNKEKLKNLQIPLPPLPIQKRIAEILDTADALRRKDEALLKKYDELAQAIFIDMFGDPVKNEKGWEVKKLGEVCDKITDGTHQSPTFTKAGIPFLFVSNIVNNQIVYETEKFISFDEFEILNKRTPIEIGNIIITTVGSYGNPAIINSTKPFAFQRHIAFLKPNHKLINYNYLFGFLKSPNARYQIERKVNGIAQKTLNLGDLKNLDIWMPPMQVQEKYSALLEKLKEIHVLNDNYHSVNLFNSLLQKAFNGELVA